MAYPKELYFGQLTLTLLRPDPVCESIKYHKDITDAQSKYLDVKLEELCGAQYETVNGPHLRQLKPGVKRSGGSSRGPKTKEAIYHSELKFAPLARLLDEECLTDDENGGVDYYTEMEGETYYLVEMMDHLNLFMTINPNYIPGFYDGGEEEDASCHQVSGPPPPAREQLDLTKGEAAIAKQIKQAKKNDAKGKEKQERRKRKAEKTEKNLLKQYNNFRPIKVENDNSNDNSNDKTEKKENELKKKQKKLKKKQNKNSVSYRVNTGRVKGYYKCGAGNYTDYSTFFTGVPPTSNDPGATVATASSIGDVNSRNLNENTGNKSSNISNSSDLNANISTSLSSINNQKDIGNKSTKKSNSSVSSIGTSLMSSMNNWNSNWNKRVSTGLSSINNFNSRVNNTSFISSVAQKDIGNKSSKKSKSSVNGMRASRTSSINMNSNWIEKHPHLLKSSNLNHNISNDHSSINNNTNSNSVMKMRKKKQQSVISSEDVSNINNNTNSNSNKDVSMSGSSNSNSNIDISLENKEKDIEMNPNTMVSRCVPKARSKSNTQSIHSSSKSMTVIGGHSNSKPNTRSMHSSSTSNTAIGRHLIPTGLGRGRSISNVAALNRGFGRLKYANGSNSIRGSHAVRVGSRNATVNLSNDNVAGTISIDKQLKALYQVLDQANQRYAQETQRYSQATQRHANVVNDIAQKIARLVNKQ